MIILGYFFLNVILFFFKSGFEVFMTQNLISPVLKEQKLLNIIELVTIAFIIESKGKD
jgi:hypothetical protein